ncbi:siderophore ABC transporter substrate-binding protein [Demequina sp. NBRC 110053]|uniref:siderophore ABC transporter substrate-binding protein n=1 Tax=Demequina sp. NBRC 110053 TaxID=1570342 RepID=UPI000A011724|nr:ABC transporter substrate-binding protein [Demequina sp. NBRC 110053]
MPSATTLRVPALIAVTAFALAACATETEPEETSSATPGSDDLAQVVDESPSAEAPTEVTVTTTYGGEDTVPYDPQSIVVLDYAALDTLDALGLGDRVVGIPAGTPAPTHLAQYADSAESVGNLFEFDTEAINALEPELIIVGGRSYDQEESMEEIAPTLNITYDWGSQAFLDSMSANTLALGQVFGLEDQAGAALQDLQAKADAVAAQAADDGTGLVVLTSGGEVSAYGPSEEGRFDFVYNILGVTPAAEQVAIDTHGDAVSFEFLAETDPELLIVLDRDAAIGEEGESAQAILDNDLVNGTSAVQNDKVVYVDTSKWYLAFGGLTAVNDMIDEVDSIVE